MFGEILEIVVFHFNVEMIDFVVFPVLKVTNQLANLHL